MGVSFDSYTRQKNYKDGLDEAFVVQKMFDETKDYAGKDGINKLIAQGYDGLGDFPNALKYYKIFIKECLQIPDATICKEFRERIKELEK